METIDANAWLDMGTVCFVVAALVLLRLIVKSRAAVWCVAGVCVLLALSHACIYTYNLYSMIWSRAECMRQMKNPDFRCSNYNRIEELKQIEVDMLFEKCIEVKEPEYWIPYSAFYVDGERVEPVSFEAFLRDKASYMWGRFLPPTHAVAKERARLEKEDEERDESRVFPPYWTFNSYLRANAYGISFSMLAIAMAWTLIVSRKQRCEQILSFYKDGGATD